MNDCALRKAPYEQLEGLNGKRYGLTPTSRQEYHNVLASFDKKLVHLHFLAHANEFPLFRDEIYNIRVTISMEVQATASNGVLLFVTNEQHTDHLSLFLVNGIVHFTYNSGTGQVLYFYLKEILNCKFF